jgi:hypothetical protein
MVPGLLPDSLTAEIQHSLPKIFLLGLHENAILAVRFCNFTRREKVWWQLNATYPTVTTRPRWCDHLITRITNREVYLEN